jgi:hypothetical protein
MPVEVCLLRGMNWMLHRSVSIPGQSRWDLWFKSDTWTFLFLSTFVFPLSVSFHQCPVTYLIYTLLLPEGQKEMQRKEKFFHLFFRGLILPSVFLFQHHSVSMQTRILSGTPENRFLTGVQICLPVTPSIMALVLFSPLCRGYRCSFSPGVKRSVRVDDHPILCTV